MKILTLVSILFFHTVSYSQILKHKRQDFGPVFFPRTGSQMTRLSECLINQFREQHQVPGEDLVQLGLFGAEFDAPFLCRDGFKNYCTKKPFMNLEHYVPVPSGGDGGPTYRYDGNFVISFNSLVRQWQEVIHEPSGSVWGGLTEKMSALADVVNFPESGKNQLKGTLEVTACRDFFPSMPSSLFDF